MVIQRKNRPDGGTSGGSDGPDLIDHLVKKSLEINPSLRQGRRSTGEVMADLKKQAIASAKEAAAERGPAEAPPASPGAATAPPPPDDPQQVANRVAAKRKVTVTYYLEQKSADYQRRLVSIQQREAQLQAERAALQQETLNDVVDFFTVVTFGTQGTEARDALAAAGQYLQKLGLTEAQLLQALKGGQ